MLNDDESHQDQAHSDQQQSRSDRQDVREEAARVSGAAHSDRDAVRVEVSRVSDVAHDDMVKALEEAKRSNPFSLTNVILATALLFGSWLGEQVWTGLQDAQKATTAGLVEIKTTLSEAHDTLLQHGFKLDTMQQDITTLKANCMTQDAVDARIRLLHPKPTGLTTPLRGAESLVGLHAATNTYE